MSDHVAPLEVKEIVLEAVVTRANGDVEDHGVVSHWQAEEIEQLPEGFLAALRAHLGR